MRESIRNYYDSIRNDRKARKKWYIIMACLAVVTVCSTSYALIKPAVTMEKSSKCGLTEHIHDDSCYEDGNLICELPEHEHSEACSTAETASAEKAGSESDRKPGKSSEEAAAGNERIMKYETDKFIVRATVPEKAGIPENAKLEAKEINDGTDEWRELYSKTKSKMKLEDPALFCRFLDISFVSDGREVEPDDTVDVRITYKNEEIKGLKKAESNVVHFADDGIEIIEADAEMTKKGDTQFTYSQDSFSVVGVVVTGGFDLTNGTYIFYDQRNDGKETYALGVDQYGSIRSVPITVDSNGYVSTTAGWGDVSVISWTYDGSALRNRYTNRYLQLGTANYGSSNSVGTSTSRVPVTGMTISNLTYFYRSANTAGYGNHDYFLGFDETAGTFYTSKADGHEYRDYLMTARVGTPEEIGLKDTDLSISDTIVTDGCLMPALKNGSSSSYTWYRSKDNKTWEKVERKKVTGDKYNMDENGRWLNASLDGGARYYYKVETSYVNGFLLTTPVSSNPYRVPYYDSLQNGSFENPKIPRSDRADDYQPFMPNNTDGMVWKTTAMDSEIEYVSVAYPNFQDYSKKWHYVEAAADGNQYVELNAKMEGALYQDVLTIPDSTMYWKLAHRGRGKSYMSGESDTMYVVVMSTDLANRYGITTQAKVQDVINNPGRYPGAAVRKITSNNRSWHYYTDAYKVPEGQYMSRYFFVAGPTSFDGSGGGSTSIDPGAADFTVGNHLDDISFSTDVPAPTPGKANLVVKKEIKGLSEADARKALARLSFKVGDKTVSGSAFVNFRKTGDNKFAAWYVQREITVPESGSSMKITEDKGSAAYDGYKCRTTAFTENSRESETNEVTVTLKENQTAEACFINEYDIEGTNLKVEKTGENNDGLQGARFRLSKKDGNSWTKVTDFTTGKNGGYDLEGIEFDTLYRIEETAPPENYLQLTESIYFKIRKEDGYFLLCSEDGKPLTSGEADAKRDKYLYTPYDTLKIINKKGYVLPETGGGGTHLYMLAGAILILGSALYMGCVSRRRKKEVN